MHLKRMIYVAAAVMCGCAHASAEPPKFRVGWVVPVANVASILFEKPGVAVHVGKTYEYEGLRFASTTTMVTALATGDLDIGTLGNTAISISIANAGLDDLRIIADELRDGVEGYYSDEYMVRDDSPIKTVEDLKGKIVGVNSQGGSMDLARFVVLRKHHLDPSRDVTFVEARLANMKAMLSDRKIDLAEATLPFSYDPGLRSIARPLFKQKDADGPTDMLVWGTRAPIIAKNRAALVDLMEDLVRTVRYLTDPANHAEVVELAAKFTKQPASNFADWLFTKKDFYRDPNLMPDVASLQRSFDLQADLGYVKQRVDANAHTDLSMLKEASARLK